MTLQEFIKNQENLWTVYLSCPAFPGKIKKSIVEANNYNDAKLTALSMFPGFGLYDE